MNGVLVHLPLHCVPFTFKFTFTFTSNTLSALIACKSALSRGSTEDLVPMIFHRAIDMRIPLDHYYMCAKPLDTFRYLLSEHHGRGRALKMRVSGRGGGRHHATDAPVAHAPQMGPICPEHGPGPCPSWLPWFYVEHGHDTCSPPAPPMLDFAGPSNWATSKPMNVEPALPMLTTSFIVADLRRARIRSPPTMVARPSAPMRYPRMHVEKLRAATPSMMRSLPPHLFCLYRLP